VPTQEVAACSEQLQSGLNRAVMDPDHRLRSFMGMPAAMDGSSSTPRLLVRQPTSEEAVPRLQGTPRNPGQAQEGSGMRATPQRSRSRMAFTWLAGVLALASCSASPSDRSTAPAPASSSPVTAGDDATQDDIATATSTPSTQPKGVLKRHDAPPQGVAEQVTFFFGGDPPDPLCASVSRATTRPSVVTNLKARSAEVLSEFDVCLVNFISSEPATIEIERPGGTVERRTIRLSRDEEATQLGFRFEALPDDPLGNYRIEATQGSIKAATTFRLAAGSEPDLGFYSKRNRDADAWELRKGEAVLLGLTGFPLDQPTSLHFYRVTDGSDPYNTKAVYVTTLRLQTNSDGQALSALSTARDDPEGCFAVVQKLAPKRTFSFCIS
jgi:hypothetical protein